MTLLLGCAVVIVIIVVVLYRVTHASSPNASHFKDVFK